MKGRMNMAMPPILIHTFVRTSDAAVSHPSLFLTVPKGLKILGGGASINSVEAANFLTASYPANLQTWFAAGKDHEVAAPASITVSVYAIQDDDDIWDVQIFSGTTPQAESHAKVAAYLPGDYVLTGGGAFVDYRGAGNMLTASFPVQPLGDGDWYAWEARSKDHQISDPALVSAYAIGIRLRSAPEGAPGVQNNVLSRTSPLTDKPEVLTDNIIPPYQVTGGGAWDNYTSAGNMLVASSPRFPPATLGPWFARGSDHLVASPARITAWAIGLGPQPDSAARDARRRERRVARAAAGGARY
jgi:hypothetical protein